MSQGRHELNKLLDKLDNPRMMLEETLLFGINKS